MATIDLSPLYRSSVGFDRMASLLDSALRSDTGATAVSYTHLTLPTKLEV